MLEETSRGAGASIRRWFDRTETESPGSPCPGVRRFPRNTITCWTGIARTSTQGARTAQRIQSWAFGARQGSLGQRGRGRLRPSVQGALGMTRVFRDTSLFFYLIEDAGSRLSARARRCCRSTSMQHRTMRKSSKSGRFGLPTQFSWLARPRPASICSLPMMTA